MTEQSSPGGVQRFIGLLLMIVAALWMAFSGLCGVWMIGSMVTDSNYPREEVLVWSIGVLIISGFSAAAGFAVFIVGRGLSR